MSGSYEQAGALPKFTSLLTLLTGICMLAASNMALAQASEDPWAIGLSAGQANYQYRAFDESDTALGLSVAYQATPWISFEAAYIDLGNVTGRILPDSMVSLVQDTLTLDARGLTLSSILHWQVASRWSLNARVGMSLLDIKKRWSGGTVVDPALAADTGGSETELTLGAHAAYSLTDEVEVHLGWQRLVVEETDVDMP